MYSIRFVSVHDVLGSWHARNEGHTEFYTVGMYGDGSSHVHELNGQGPDAYTCTHS